VLFGLVQHLLITYIAKQNKKLTVEKAITALEVLETNSTTRMSGFPIDNRQLFASEGATLSGINQ